MRILIASKYAYEPSWKGFSKCGTGYGLMVRKIMKCISDDNEVCILTNSITEEKNKDVPRHSLVDVIAHAQISDWMNGLSALFKTDGSLKRRVKEAYCHINRGFIRDTYKTFRPDVVHIHGITEDVQPYAAEADKLGIPVLFTSHGLIGLDSTMVASDEEKRMEKRFFIESFSSGRTVSVLSSGMKDRICRLYLGVKNADNIVVIPNGVDEPDLGSENGELPRSHDTVLVIDPDGKCDKDFVVSLFDSSEDRHIIICTTENCWWRISNLKENEFFSGNVSYADYDHCARRFESICGIAHSVYFLSEMYSDFQLIQAAKLGKRIFVKKGYSSFLDYRLIEPCNKSNAESSSGFVEVLAPSIVGSSLNKSLLIRTLSKLCYTPEGVDERALCDMMGLLKFSNSRILSYVANITENKNQLQAVRAMSLIRNENALLFLFGREADGGVVREEIERRVLKDRVFQVGYFSNPSYLWQFTDANLLLSRNDGFGLSVAEGMMEGVPSVMFSDLDAFNDLYCECGIVPVWTRSDEAVAEAINLILSKTWNRERIKEQGLNHSCSRMKSDYCSVYRAIGCR